MAKRRAAPRFRDPFRKLGDLLLWMLIVIAPLVVVVSAKNAFRLPKLLAFEWLGLASLVAFGLAAAVAGRAGGARRWWRSPALLAAAPVVAAASLGLVLGRHPVLTREALADLWIGAACLVGWSLAVSAERLERFVRGLTLPASLLAALGILQFHGGFRPFRFIGGEEAFRTGVTSLAGNAGDLGAFLVLPAVVAQWGLVGAFRRAGARRKGETGARRRAALWAAALLLSVYGIAVTQTLTAIVALLAATAVFWLLHLPARRAVALAAAGAVVAGLLVATVPPVRARVAAVGGQLAEGDWNAALTGRLDGWRAAGWMFREHPLTGVGHGAYRAEFGPAKLALQDAGVEFYRGHADPFFANAHNDLLEAAAEWGVPGLLALAWALFVLGRALRRWRASGDGEGWAAAVAGLTGALVLAVGQFPFHLALVAYPYLLVLAWVFRRSEAAAAPEEVEAPSPGRLAAVLPWLAAAAVALALVAHTARARDRLEASKQLRVVEVMSEQMARSGRVVDSLVAGNFRLLRQAARSDPTEVGVPVALAGQYMLLERHERAAELYREALEREARPEIYLNLGRALRAAGREEEAQEAFEKAVRLAPTLRRELPPGVRVRR